MKSIQEAVASVQNAFPSVFTKDDVVSLLNSIEIETTQAEGAYTKEQVLTLVELIIAEVEVNVENLDTDCVDRGTAEFSLNYNEIELDSVDLNTREIKTTVTSGLMDVAEDYFAELEEKKDEEVVVDELVNVEA